MPRSNLNDFARELMEPVFHELQLFEHPPLFAPKKDDKPLTHYRRQCTMCDRVFKTDDGEARHMQNYHKEA